MAEIPKPSLILIAGPSGAGKTTVAQALAYGMGLASYYVQFATSRKTSVFRATEV